jgi:site-specific DNA-methyltransferase (adenine-specific)
MTPYYEHGGITIYHGDCREILPEVWFGVDLVLTDPPYGIARFEKGFGYTRFKGHGAERDGLAWDKRPDADLLSLVLRSGTNAIVWGANNFSLPASEYFFVWDKQQTVSNFASAELAYTNLKVPAKVFRYSIHKHNQTSTHDHPTQKPLELMKWCLSFAPNANLVLDPFMGSGTTLVAAKEMGRRAIGIEREESYCEIAAKRLSQEVLPLEVTA